jgi:hypothetical protein
MGIDRTLRRREIECLRRAARSDHGWIMDTYLLTIPANRPEGGE